MKPQAPATQNTIIDQDGNPIQHQPKAGPGSAMDWLALGAGVALLLAAGKSRSPIGGLIKGSAATALLGRAAQHSGLLGKAAGILAGSARRNSIRR